MSDSTKILIGIFVIGMLLALGGWIFAIVHQFIAVDLPFYEKIMKLGLFLVAIPIGITFIRFGDKN